MTGGDFAGKPVLRRGGVLWFAAEGEREIVGRVRTAVESKFGASGPQPFARQANDVPVLTEDDAFGKLLAHAREAQRRMRDEFGLPLAAIGIDTMSAAAGFEDEDKPKETQKVMNKLRALSKATGAFVFIIDHYGKMVETGVAVRLPRAAQQTLSLPVSETERSTAR